MNCPLCDRDLGKGLEVDLNSMGWTCSHPGYDIKIYKVKR